MTSNEIQFQENYFPRKAFQKKFHEKQENHNGGKARKPGLLILSLVSISWQKLLDISAGYLTNNTCV